MSAWLSAFLFTQAVELPFYLRGLRPRPLATRLAIAFAASTLTHPLLWFGSRYVPLSYTPRILVCELLVVVVEGAWLAAFRVQRPFRLALLANAASAAIGLASRAVFGWP